MIVQCCVCKKYRQDGTWTHLNDTVADGRNVSHGYCPECAANAFAQLAVSLPRTAAKPTRKSTAA